MKRTYRVMTNLPEPSDAEAARWQNFDQLLTDYRAVRQRRQRWWSGSLLVLTLLIAGGGIWAYWSSSPPTASPPRVVSRPVAPFEPQRPPVLRPVLPVAVPPVAPVAKSKTPTRPAAPSEAKTFVDAVPAGGYPALYDYLAQQLQYPEAARRAEVSGTVLIEFTIDTLGQPTNIGVVQGVRDDLDQEAIRLIRQMPRWTPASVGTEPVATKHTMPLHFQLTNP